LQAAGSGHGKAWKSDWKTKLMGSMRMRMTLSWQFTRVAFQLIHPIAQFVQVGAGQTVAALTRMA